MNKTKIIATIDYSNNDVDVIKDLIGNGVDAFCIKAGHVDREFCINIMENIKKINKELGTNVAVMLETYGPKVHINKVSGGKAVLATDDKIRIYVDNVLGDETKFSVDYKNIIQEVKYGSIIKTSNGNVELEVLDKGSDFLLCKVKNGGEIYSGASINILDIKLNKEYVSNEERELIEFASSNDVDYLILSYVRGMDDVLDVNDILIDLENNHLGIIARIENKDALEEIDDIINTSEGVIIARDNLSIEMPTERIPGVQKSLINKCHLAGKISIVETEIISSSEQELSGAEVSDIANAVLDGADAVLLSNKISSTDYPMDTLKIMERIVKSAELDIDYLGFLDRTIRSENQDITGNIAGSVAEISNRLKCKAIVAPTMSGYTAKKMSRFRPCCPIIAMSPDVNTVKSLSIYFGVCPVLISDLKSLDDIVDKSRNFVLEKMNGEQGDKIIISGGYPFKEVKHTNLIEIEEL